MSALKVNVKADFSDVRAMLAGYPTRQIPFATSLALNRAADFVVDEVSKESQNKLSAKPFTTGKNAFYVRRSSKYNLSAEIGYKTLQARYMKWLLGGGQRVAKGFEAKLRGMGILPNGYVTVPGAAMKLDSYGNMPMAALGQILSQLASMGMASRGSASVRVFAGRGKRAHGQVLFVVPPNSSDARTRGMHPGIWQRIERGGASVISPLIMYVQHAQYRPGKFFDFSGVATKAAVDGFRREFPRALEEAKAAAR